MAFEYLNVVVEAFNPTFVSLNVAVEVFSPTIELLNVAVGVFSPAFELTCRLSNYIYLGLLIIVNTIENCDIEINNIKEDSYDRFNL